MWCCTVKSQKGSLRIEAEMCVVKGQKEPLLWEGTHFLQASKCVVKQGDNENSCTNKYPNVFDGLGVVRGIHRPQNGSVVPKMNGSITLSLLHRTE